MVWGFLCVISAALQMICVSLGLNNLLKLIIPIFSSFSRDSRIAPVNEVLLISSRIISLLSASRGDFLHMLKEFLVGEDG